MGEADTRLRLPRSSTLAENEKAPFGFHQGGCVLTLTHSEPDEALGVDGSKKTRLASRKRAPRRSARVRSELVPRRRHGRSARTRVGCAARAAERRACACLLANLHRQLLLMWN